MTRDDGVRPHICRAHDGTPLRGLLWDLPSPRGAVLIRTPYDAARHAATARGWCERGYRCLVQDVRGRHRSEGSWEPYLHEGPDGAAALDALRAERPGLPVLLAGASYAAHTALEAARAGVGAAALVLLVPALGLAETAYDAAGRAQLEHRIGWWHEHGDGARSRPPLPAAELARRAALVRAEGTERAAEAWGWSETARAGWSRLWAAERVDLSLRYGGVRAPLLLVRGDRDFFLADAGRLAAAWTGGVHLVDGPWGHGIGADLSDRQRDRLAAAGGLGGVLDAWLRAHGLPARGTGRPSPVPDQAITRSVYDDTEGAWRHERTPA